MRSHAIAPTPLRRFALLGSRGSVEVDDAVVRVRAGVLFTADIPRTAIASVRTVTPSHWSGIGVHMIKDGWIVNSGFGDAVELRFHEPVPARTVGIPLHPRRLVLGVTDPDALVADLGG